jgi:segregation and condensation protein B
LDTALLRSIVEGLVFAHHEPLSVDTLAQILQGVSGDRLKMVLDELEEEYRLRNRGFVLAKVGGGYQFRSLPQTAPWILRLKSIKPSRLSRAALETLAIVAYNQPVTRHEIEQVRGVESAGTLKHLLERELVTVVGRREIAGRPLLYGTTRRFLEVFGLTDLASLPPLPEPESLAESAD